MTQNFHEFIFDLQTDPQGNFYFVKGGPVRPGGRGWDKVTPHHGCVFKVSKDGSKLEVLARGFRAPNGMGVGPNGEITVGDNEGTWTPMCPLNWITPGGFYGVPDFSDRTPKPSIRDNPLCWLPRDIDNSNGGQVWITSDKFGPLSGRLLHTSYGTCSLYNVLVEEVAGQKQGGVAPLLKFDTGVLPGPRPTRGKTSSTWPGCAVGRPVPRRTPASIASATPARSPTSPPTSTFSPGP